MVRKGHQHRSPLLQISLLLTIFFSSNPSAFGDDKWLIYQRPEPDFPAATYVYSGYVAFPEPGSLNDKEKLSLIQGKLFPPEGGTPPETPKIHTEKPVIDEKDDARVLVFAFVEQTDTLLCKRVETVFRVTDAKVVPPTPVEPRAQPKETKPPSQRVPFICNLGVRDKGGIQISYSVVKPVGSASEKKELLLLEDFVHVHDLYRFRVIAGPVYTTLKRRAKSFSVITDSSGNRIVSSSPENDSPVNFPLMLKVYVTPRGRDILVPLSWDPATLSFYERLSPLVGVNLVESPLKNFYLGLSFELKEGLDIVAGAHWAKTKHLTGGFFEGQVTTAASVPTRERYDNGWFIGSAVDIGVIGAWLKNNVAPVFTGK